MTRAEAEVILGVHRTFDEILGGYREPINEALTEQPLEDVLQFLARPDEVLRCWRDEETLSLTIGLSRGGNLVQCVITDAQLRYHVSRDDLIEDMVSALRRSLG